MRLRARASYTRSLSPGGPSAASLPDNPPESKHMSDPEVLVVVSKLKNYIKSKSGMNTSGNAAPAVSDLVRQLCDGAIARAQKDGRKTVMDRDFEMPGGGGGDAPSSPGGF